MPDASLIAALIVVAVLFVATVAITTIMVQISCWMYNKINGLAPPGLGRSDSRDYTMVASPQGKYYQPPTAFSRYESGKTVSGGVPVPGIMRSASMAFLATTAMTVVVLGLWLVIGAAASATGSTASMSVLLCTLVSIPLDVLILAWLAGLILPTTFRRGVLIALVHFMLALVLVSVSAVVAGLVGLALNVPIDLPL